MSIKAQTFQKLLGNPLNTHNFIVEIADPGNTLSSIQLLCSSTTYPSEQLQDFVLYFQGERVKFPSIPTNSGTWTATFPEGEYAKLAKALKDHMKKSYNQQTGKMTHWSLTDKFDIVVKARGLREASDSTSELFSVKLVGCYMKGREDVSLANNNPTENWVWTVTFSYDYLEDGDVKPYSGAPTTA